MNSNNNSENNNNNNSDKNQRSLKKYTQKYIYSDRIIKNKKQKIYPNTKMRLGERYSSTKKPITYSEGQRPRLTITQ